MVDVAFDSKALMIVSVRCSGLQAHFADLFILLVSVLGKSSEVLLVLSRVVGWGVMLHLMLLIVVSMIL